MIKGVIFDMDGLMFDTERLWDTFWEPACEELGVPMPQDLATFYASGRGLAGQYLIEHVQKYFPQVDPQKMLDKVWQIGDARFAQGVPCKPGLKELLALLEERGLPRIVASSSPRNMIEQNLQTTGTARYFHDIVCGADVQHSKPAPDIFLEAARRLKLDIHDCLVLEDSFNGVRAGHAAGAVTVMVPDLAQPDEEIRRLYDYCCHDLYEVREMLLQGKL
jgi:HAD superfamily hydrolase (TIGR01509 family)